MIGFYNDELNRFNVKYPLADKITRKKDVNAFINNNPKKISWSVNLKQDLVNNKNCSFAQQSFTSSIYRPFTKEWLYFSRQLNERVLQMPKIFPFENAENRIIMIKGNWTKEGQIALMTDCVSSDQPDGGAQCFPLKLYEIAFRTENDNEESTQDELFSASEIVSEQLLNDTDGSHRLKDGITDEALAHFQTAYPTETITKQDIFYYIYGLLHSEDYKKRYADNLTKELPRIPCVKKAGDFWAFSHAGRDLTDLHVNYEAISPYPVNFAGGELFMSNFTDADYRVEQMKFGKSGKVTDKTTVIYNHKIKITNIPLEAYDYVVNGKPALEWVIERQAVTTHKESGIVNDANLWATEKIGDASYPLKLFQRVITVSLETMKIVRALPRLDI